MSYQKFRRNNYNLAIENQIIFDKIIIKESQIFKYF